LRTVRRGVARMRSTPSTFSGLRERALRALRTGRASSAERSFRHLLMHRSADVALLQGLGLSLLVQNKASAAITVFRSAIQAAPDFLSARVGLARAQRAAGSPI